MSKPEMTADPMREVTQAVSGFLGEFRDFQGEIELKLQQTEERLTMLDRKTHHAARPHLAAEIDSGAPHRKAFHAYLRSGDDDGLRGLEFEQKALSTVVNSDGGFLVYPQTAEQVQSVLYSAASLRAVAQVPAWRPPAVRRRPSGRWRLRRAPTARRHRGSRQVHRRSGGEAAAAEAGARPRRPGRR